MDERRINEDELIRRGDHIDAVLKCSVEMHVTKRAHHLRAEDVNRYLEHHVQKAADAAVEELLHGSKSLQELGFS